MMEGTERDFYECWDMARHTDTLKDCSTCSWNGQDITRGTSVCEIVVEQGSREGRITYG